LFRTFPDCPKVGPALILPPIKSTIRLSPEDKLDLLRRLDQFRKWSSIDDQRQCLVCGKTITGRQIEVSGGTRGRGPFLLQCPTEGCSSIPIDWILPDRSVRTARTTDLSLHPPVIMDEKIEFTLSMRLKRLQAKLRRRRPGLAAR